MARLVRVASVLFQTAADRGQSDAKQIVLEETECILRSLRGYGLDLIVFSEGIEATGQEVEDAEDVNNPGPFLNSYMGFAASEHCLVAGSVKLQEDGAVYNSIVFVGPNGKVLGTYHKTNLTIGEISDGLKSGGGAVLLETPIGKLGGIICFDLNFEDIRKEYSALKPDILVFASMYHGGLMQQIWAYECRAYFVSALPFLGGGIMDPFGTPLALTDCYSPIASAVINLDRAMVHLDYNREKFPDIIRKYHDEVEIRIPPNIGSALIISRTDERSAADIVMEFELEPLDVYFSRASQANSNNRTCEDTQHVEGSSIPKESR
ncbi:MAG: carbon-nitrogen hydrolase family protein [Anaerolineae bacterium]|nr:carbon-nitrogen hydrolase family protein [Anaerolineae bacterium]